MALLVPRIRDFFNEMMTDPFESFFGSAPVQHTPSAIMHTDIKQTETGYELIVDLPGFSKENVTADLKDGILTIKAKTETETEEKSEKKDVWVRKERFSGQCSRSFYVGEDIDEAEIKARFENGTLIITVPKKIEQPKLDEGRTIAIEG